MFMYISLCTLPGEKCMSSMESGRCYTFRFKQILKVSEFSKCLGCHACDSGTMYFIWYNYRIGLHFYPSRPCNV